LSIIEFKKIKIIVAKYNEEKTNIELLLLKKAKEFSNITEDQKLLLEQKRILYSSLIPYIDKKFKKEYLEYIK
jgi:hypothetical protein